MFREDFPVHAGAVVETLEVCGRHEPQEVPVTGLGLGQHGDVVREAFVRIPFEAAAGCDVTLDAEDGFNAVRLAGLVEVDCAMDVAVVSESDGRHSEFGRPGGHVVQPAQAVEQAVLGVVMEMDKLIHGRGHGNSCCASRNALLIGRPAGAPGTANAMSGL